MPSALVLYFNDKTERTIKELWLTLESEGIPLDYSVNIRPHLTLGIFDELPCESCHKELEIISEQCVDLQLTFSHIGLFYEPEVVLFLAPIVTDILLKLHADIHKILAVVSKNPWEYYQPGKWVPHCTLALGIHSEQFKQALNVCSQVQLPMNVSVSQIDVVEFQPMNGLRN